nr:RecName: Full=Trypsin inhibitor; AltName: Full=MTI [Mythimna unipuncta]
APSDTTIAETLTITEEFFPD